MPAISDVVKDSSGALVSRLVRAYRRDTGAFVGQTLSNPVTGAYSITTADTSEHFVMAHDTSNADPNWDKVVLAMRMSDTGLTDIRGHAVTLVNAARVADANAFSGFSAGFDGSGDYLTIPDSADWDFGTGDFRIAMFVTFTAHTSIMALVGNYLNSTTGFSLQRRSDTNTIRFGNGDTALLDVSWTPTDGVRYFLELCRVGTSLFAKVNGTQVGSAATNSTNITGSTGNLVIGSLYTGTYIQNFNGKIEELEIYKGVGTPASSVPTAPFKTVPVGGTENAIILDRITPV